MSTRLGLTLDAKLTFASHIDESTPGTWHNQNPCTLSFGENTRADIQNVHPTSSGFTMYLVLQTLTIPQLTLII